MRGMSNKVSIVCLSAVKAKHLEYEIFPLSTLDKCEGCDVAIWVAPSSRAIKKEKPDAVFQCEDCVIVSIADSQRINEKVECAISPHTLKEFTNWKKQ